MRLQDWLRPGIRIKRWISYSIFGVLIFSIGLSVFIKAFIPDIPKFILATLLLLTGIIIVILSTGHIITTFYNSISTGGLKVDLNSECTAKTLNKKRGLNNGPNIVAVGGGTGISTMLRGLKSYSSNLTAVVTVCDDGGGSGVLREDLGMIPPGDIRNCIMSLAETEPVMDKLLNYRFEEGMLKGQSFGNLFLAAMNGISGSFEEAVGTMSKVLAVTGKVLPISLEDIKLYAKLSDGTTIIGESNIGNRKTSTKIDKVYLDPEDVEPLSEVISCIYESDIIILGPGSLYTSIIPNLLIKDVSDAVKNSKALVIYVCNIMTQPGESSGYSVYDHLDAIRKHSLDGIIDYCIVNNSTIPGNLEKKYKDEGAELVKIDYEKIRKLGVEIIAGNFLSIKNDLIRHDTKKLSETIVNLYYEKNIKHRF